MLSSDVATSGTTTTEVELGRLCDTHSPESGLPLPTHILKAVLRTGVLFRSDFLH